MHVFLRRTIAAACVLSAGSALARDAANCATPAERAAGLRYVRTAQTVVDLGLTIPAGQDAAVQFAGAAALDGACAQAVHSTIASQVGFADGATFNWNAGAGRFDHIPRIDAPRPDPKDAFAPHPAIAGATFIMAVGVDGQHTPRGLDVGLWRTGTETIVAAFTRLDDGFGAPVELLRSAHPLRSITYFPALHINAGTLGMVEETGSGIALVTLRWNHDALSRSLRP